MNKEFIGQQIYHSWRARYASPDGNTWYRTDGGDRYGYLLIGTVTKYSI